MSDTKGHLINCDVAPFIPENCQTIGGYIDGALGGNLHFDATRLGFYLSEAQRSGRGIKGTDLVKEINDKPVLRANVLDYLLANPDLIPEAWKSLRVFFWGTIYLYSGDRLFVRCLVWNSDHWDWQCAWLADYEFGASDVSVFLDYAKPVIRVRHVINCRVKPFKPKGLHIEKHTRHSDLLLCAYADGRGSDTAEKIRLYFSEIQKAGQKVLGAQVGFELKARKVLNANVLDYLLAHTELIPESWKSVNVYFWGTIYYDDLYLYVKCLYWRDGRWCSGYRRVDEFFSASEPAAVLTVSA